MAFPNFYAHCDPTYIVSLLQSHLPQCGPLLRRIQHDIVRKSTTAYYLATFPPDAKFSGAQDLCTPWLAAYVDIETWPATQVWLYSSLEAGNNILSDGKSVFNSDDSSLNQARMQMISLISYCFDELLPKSLSRLKASNGVTVGTYADLPLRNPETTLLLGSMHTGLVKLLRETMALPDPLPYPRYHIPLNEYCAKYLFPRHTYDLQCDGESVVLPPGYRICSRNGLQGFQPYQHDLIQSRSYIIRPKEALQNMASVVLYYDGDGHENTRSEVSGNEGMNKSEEMPVAWTFLGYDASLVSLHVEPEHRGRGLATYLAKAVMRRGMLETGQFLLGKEHEKEGGWVFADVALDNRASLRAMEKTGGELGWTISWIIAERCFSERCAGCARDAIKNADE